MGQRAAVILGGSGMLGRAMRDAMLARGWNVHALGRDAADLSRPETIDPALAARRADAVALGAGAVVVNCAAWTDVDGAETREAEATMVNGEAVGVLAESCLRRGLGLVHFSTDYVFDGRGVSPYPVDAPIRPLNAYGRSKALGERLIADARARGLHAAVVRTSWLYAPWGKNFVRTIAKAARERPSLRVVNDQRGRPTSAQGLARTTIALIEAEAEGTLHATDGGEATWFDFARAIAARINPECRVEPCTTAEFPRPAARPAHSVLDLAETERIAGPMRPWTDALADVLDRLE